MPKDNDYEYNYNERIDIYCYPNTNILINKFNIRNYDELNIVERQITALKIAEIEKNPIVGQFDLKHIQNIHEFIFGDIFAWAGKIREGDFLIKGDSIFCRAMHIENMANEIYQELKQENFLTGLVKGEFIRRLAFYMGEINALHPFREGNGRVQRLYFKCLCKNAGYSLDFNKTDKNTLINADIMAFNKNFDSLIEVLEKTVSKQG